MTEKKLYLHNRFRTKNMINFLAGRHSSPLCIDEFMKKLAEGMSMEMAAVHAMYMHHRIQTDLELAEYLESSEDLKHLAKYTNLADAFPEMFSEYAQEYMPRWVETPTEVIVGFEWTIPRPKDSKRTVEKED